MNNEVNNNQPTTSKPKNIIAELIDYVEIFIFSTCAVLLIFSFFIRVCKVDGPSMNQTLIHGEVLITTNVFYKPEQFDIIVFHQTSEQTDRYNEPIVKRVIATGNHYVKIDFNNSLVYVSEDAIFDAEDLINEQDYAYLDIGRWRMNGVLETYVPDGKLFVMGDNRNNSADSRSHDIGLVDTRRVLGKVILRIFPLEKFTFFS